MSSDKKYKISDKYSWNTKVATYDADEGRDLRISSQLRIQQEAGELHLDLCGLPYKTLYERGMIFVLTRTRSKIYRAPKLEEDIEISTWHRGSNRIQFYRCYSFLDASGELLADSVSSFALMDPQTRTLMRPKAFLEICENPEGSDLTNSCEDPNKIKFPENMTAAGEFIVRYSNIDYNSHLNNTVYGDIICDFMPGGMRNKRIKEFSINFLNEALLDDIIEMKTSLSENTAYFVGTIAGKKCFEASAVIEEIDR